MKDYRRQINRQMLIAWGVIIIILLGSYLLEVFKEERTWNYYLIFALVTVLPFLVCLGVYALKKDEKHFAILMTCGYFIMYAFVLLTGSTVMVFSYILPLLSFMVLFHQPKLILTLGAASIGVNIISIGFRVYSGAVTMENSKDAEIQIALLLLCFGGAWISSRTYDQITRKNQEYLETVLAQASKISEQKDKIDDLSENIALEARTARIDTLTSLQNRLAFDEYISNTERAQGRYGVIYCDVNGLKLKNDTEGHLVGDMLLQEVAKIMMTHFRADNCYRVSGDEFVIIITGLERDIFDIRAERFYRACWIKNPPIAAAGWHYGDDLSETIKNAEATMYKDKQKFYQEYPLYKR